METTGGTDFNRQSGFDEINDNQNQSRTRIFGENENYNNRKCLSRRFAEMFCQCSTKKEEIVVKITVFLFTFFGIIKIVVGTISLSNGYPAIILANFDQLMWVGSIVIFTGVSSALCGIINCRQILRKNYVILTSKQIHIVNFVIFYVVVFDIVAIIISSKFNEPTFLLDIRSGMDTTLQRRYDVSAKEYKVQWDNLQEESTCCGSKSYEDWFKSAWADRIRTSDKVENPLPQSCSLQLKPSTVCNAVAGIPSNGSSNYISASNYTLVTECNLEDFSEGKVVYIFSQPCSDVYSQKLKDILFATLLTCSILGLIDTLILTVLVRTATKLPGQQIGASYTTN